jgi:hypothetical protein
MSLSTLLTHFFCFSHGHLLLVKAHLVVFLLIPYFSSSAHHLPYFFKPLVVLLISSNPKSYPKLHLSCGTYIMHALSPTISGPVRISCFSRFSGFSSRILSEPLIPASMCVAYVGILGAYSHSTALAYYPKCSTLPTENAH